MTTLRITESDFDSAVDVAVAHLKGGGILVHPTDTVYGLGGDATSEDAVAKIRKLKGIKEKKPMSVMVSDFGMIDYYCESGVWEDIILKKYLPGPYTFVLKKQRYIAASDTDKLGIRIPDSAFCQALCQRFGRPIITTSANLTSKAPPTRIEEVEKSILLGAGLAIDGGETKYKSPSVVIDLVEHRMLREGSNKSISLIELPEQ
jgi:L-threonylcarbamoyladenylate synthase